MVLKSAHCGVKLDEPTRKIPTEWLLRLVLTYADRIKFVKRRNYVTRREGQLDEKLKAVVPLVTVNSRCQPTFL